MSSLSLTSMWGAKDLAASALTLGTAKLFAILSIASGWIQLIESLKLKSFCRSFCLPSRDLQLEAALS